eukprot:gene5084-biopygen15833
MDWKKHKKFCKKWQAAHSEDGVAPGGGEGAGGGGAAAAGGRSSNAVAEEDEIENPCPVCLDNEDDAIVDGKIPGMCTACGQSYCGLCNTGGLASRLGSKPTCPTCRAPSIVSDEDKFKRTWKLEHDRSPGRHTPGAQYILGGAYLNGEGVKQDYVETVKWFQKSAEAGFAPAQLHLGLMYFEGRGVEHDFSKAVRWAQLAAVQGTESAVMVIDDLQLAWQANAFPTPPPGTTVTIILLTSANAAKYNDRTGRVIAPPEGVAIKPGRAVVLLDGDATPPISFKLKNLKLE